ncbi:hypothetical protein [Pseudoalteromonas sp. OF7H-1]|uniref:hypothetical protein n=1 Tax=Pseudoalteromonas sp. OF7H-1 TaxID=2917755 RepID=UPI001EF46BAF|nr:hypothetical protein [Pseudoalteromonas sp. OF7H-1]MCG7542543.1 hypothetical protein [Pseudoalteromonas sp. OF7H-1]
MTTFEKSSLKFKRDIKKAALFKQREITHQQERFINFFEGLSLESTVQLVSYSEGQAYKQAIFRDARSVLNPLTKKAVCKELKQNELREFGEFLISKKNEIVLLFSIHDYSFPSVLLSVEEFFNNFELILDLMENEVTIVFGDMQDAFSFNNEDDMVRVNIFGDKYLLQE